MLRITWKFQYPKENLSIFFSPKVVGLIWTPMGLNRTLWIILKMSDVCHLIDSENKKKDSFHCFGWFIYKNRHVLKRYDKKNCRHQKIWKKKFEKKNLLLHLIYSSKPIDTKRNTLEKSLAIIHGVFAAVKDSKTVEIKCCSV